ncbi:response regulator transcription factor [Nocardioides sp. CFH 31398]|uniref:response regulator transcription factor n=1 Tax=Nocardioides sp. CFH 31398 TaxID=2919579 RepID=UPI001F055828|nr:response regulator transcription factor [Nocardioides sp. CFH 31398]MCH1868507.1 response regulator transcription factor [Nocardioides sp. CFH 31398]
MSGVPLRVALVNDHALVVAGTAGLLAPFAGRIRLVEQAVEVAHDPDVEVDVVLYDTYALPGEASIDLDRALAGSDARLVVYSWNVDPDVAERALAAGASGVVSKAASAETLVESLERIHAGEELVVLGEPGVRGDAAAGDDGAAPGRWPGHDHGLSPRESEVLALICMGLSNVEVAERAVLGANTVKSYVRSLYRKIGVTTRAQAILWGVEHGFLPDRVRRVHHGDG